MCPSRVAVNGANRKEVVYRFTAEDDAKPKVEIEYDPEVKPGILNTGPIEPAEELKPEIDRVDGVEDLEGRAAVDTISVKPEPL